MSRFNNPAIGKYLELMEKKNPVQKPLYWWSSMDEKEFIQTLQNMLWDSNIDHYRINWMKLLRGEYIPTEEELSKQENDN